MSLVDIIIPSFNNWAYLGPCLQSILSHRTTPGLARVIVVNNGHKDSIPDSVRTASEITVIDAEKNLGWEGGLKRGLEQSKADYVVLMNDDTYIPYSSASWLLQILQYFANPKVGAVGPASNCVMGVQNIFIPCTTTSVMETSFLIGYCVAVRRAALDQVGGIDDSLPYHGDDLDLSIRLRGAGYKLICDKGIFVYHHGFKTGGREFGGEWNSAQMTERTNNHLIRKHGLRTFWQTMNNPVVANPTHVTPKEDTEGDVIRKYAHGNILELGCGAQKTVEPSTGIDIIPRGETIPGLVGKTSIADIVSDIQEELPVAADTYDMVIARHLIEHLVDPIKVLRDWRRVIKPGGKLILAVPDQGKRHTIPMNYQHVHAYTQDSLRNLMETQGWHTEVLEDSSNEVSFVGVFQKNGVNNGHE